MNKIIIALAALAAISFAAPAAHAEVDCDDEDEIAQCMRSFMPKRMPMPGMPSMPRAPRSGDMPAAAAQPPTARPAPKAPVKPVAEAPAKVGGPAAFCRKYLSSIGEMIDARCD